jgi:hypothetical protein
MKHTKRILLPFAFLIWVVTSDAQEILTLENAVKLLWKTITK